MGRFFYAVGKKGKYLLNLESNGILTPGPDGAQAVPLTMWVNTGVGDIELEGCSFVGLVCHGNPLGKQEIFTVRSCLIPRVFAVKDLSSASII